MSMSKIDFILIASTFNDLHHAIIADWKKIETSGAAFSIRCQGSDTMRHKLVALSDLALMQASIFKLSSTRFNADTFYIACGMEPYYQKTQIDFYAEHADMSPVPVPEYCLQYLPSNKFGYLWRGQV